MSRTNLHMLLAAFKEKIKLPATVRLSIDVDPVDLF
jgi:primosomal protein N'